MVGRWTEPVSVYNVTTTAASNDETVDLLSQQHVTAGFCGTKFTDSSYVWCSLKQVYLSVLFFTGRRYSLNA